MSLKIEFVKSVFNLNELPKNNLKEVILCGRSNVGKSSFINSLFNRKNLAKTSSTPGKTQSLNFYLVEKKIYFVDLPGYGYAKTSKTEREKWNKLITDYISFSKNILLAVHLIDSRLNPTELDISLNKYLRAREIPYIVILTKADKLKQSEISAVRKNGIKLIPVNMSDLFLYSSVNKLGRIEIENYFKNLIS